MLTGLDWYDVFAHLPLELDVDDDSLAMEQLVPSAYCGQDPSDLLTQQACQAIAEILCSPDYAPGALIKKAFWMLC